MRIPAPLTSITQPSSATRTSSPAKAETSDSPVTQGNVIPATAPTPPDTFSVLPASCGLPVEPPAPDRTQPAPPDCSSDGGTASIPDRNAAMADASTVVAAVAPPLLHPPT